MTAAVALPRSSALVRVVATQVVGFGAVAALLLLLLGRDELVVLLAVAFLAVSQGVALAPRFRRVLLAVAGRVQHGVGLVLSVVLLTPVYVLIVTPATLLMRLFGADALRAGDAGRAAGPSGTTCGGVRARPSRTSGTAPRPVPARVATLTGSGARWWCAPYRRWCWCRRWCWA